MTLYEMAKLIYFKPHLLGILVGFHLIWGFCKMVIYNKLGIKNSWIAFIPVLSYKPMFDVAGLSPLLLFTAFIPYVGSFLYSMTLVVCYYYFFVNLGCSFNWALIASTFIFFSLFYVAFFNDRILYSYRRRFMKARRFSV